MPDRSAENLERIRACDAGWNENDHPRANNGQFTSGGGGAKVSKLQSGGKAKASSIKAGEIAKNQERYDKAHKSMASLYLSDLTNAIKKGDYESAREHLDSHERDKKYYDRLTAKNNKFKAAKATLEKARPGIAKMRELAKAAKPKAAKPKASKNNGGLEDYKYKPPSKLEGFPIVMVSKKTNSGLGGGNRFKFGFKKYKDGIMIRYVDDFWDASDYAFVPLKNPTLENAYSYSDKASSDTVSALKDSLVTNEELGKIARQLK